MLGHDTMIPAAPLAPIVNKYLDAQDDPLASFVLAERAQVHYDTVRAIAIGDQERVSFNIADRLLCKTVGAQIWYQDPELHDIYTTVELHDDGRAPVLPPLTRRCAAPGCIATFEVPPSTDPRGRHESTRGHSRRLYCSNGCRQRTNRIIAGKQANIADGRDYRCRNGHIRTPENTEHLSNGTRRCRICNRERTQESRQRRRELKAAA